MVVGVPLTPRAAKRLGREGATQSFDKAAAALRDDWGTPLDGKQVQRWSETLGQRVVAARQSEVRAYEQGHRPEERENAGTLLVIGMDGGRVQGQEVNPETQNRWHESKVLTATSYLAGDGTDDHPPHRLVTTYVATMAKAEAFGKMVHVEAERRGMRRAKTVLVLGDAANWIGPLSHRERLHDVRIVDYYHAAEHLYEAARAACGRDSPAAKPLGDQLKTWLWHGEMDRVLSTLRMHADQLGTPQPDDGPQHPRRVVAGTVGYFERHQHHMNYPEYRKKGWPIGSGVTEAGVKQFNKRVKGTDQFWSQDGVESILALRALWLSEDDRWERYWRTRPAYRQAA